MTNLVQIGEQPAEKTVSIREMFEQMAAREAEMIREARERALRVQRELNHKALTHA
jgi:hypothetical protein